MIIRSAVFIVLLGLWAGMGWADWADDVATTKTIPTFDACGYWGAKQPDGVCQVWIQIEPGWRVMYQDRDIAVCLDRMEAAMRAMEKYIPKFVDPVERRRMAKSGGWVTDDLVCRNCYFGGEEWVDTRSIEQKLAGDKARYEREQEDRGRQIVEDAKERWAYQEWDAVKRECWRNP